MHLQVKVFCLKKRTEPYGFADTGGRVTENLRLPPEEDEGPNSQKSFFWTMSREEAEAFRQTLGNPDDWEVYQGNMVPCFKRE